MAKKDHFQASSLSLSDDIDTSIGVMSDRAADAPQVSKNRLEELRALMQKASPEEQHPTPQETPKDDLVEKLVPADFETILPRNQLKPAPEAWNFFGKPDPDQYALIFQSIYKYGLWHPLTVWQQEDGSYMILGGHTRNQAYQDLYDITQDEKYLSIPCKVYKHDQISEATARRIVILTNIAQRAQEKSRVRIHCYTVMAQLEKQEAFYGSGTDVNTAVARLFGVSRAQVFQYRKLEHLIDPLLDALDRKELSLRTALAFSDLTPELQEIAYHRAYYVDATAAQLKKLKSIENEADLKAIFETIPDAPEKYQYVFSTTIPKPENYDTVSFYIGQEEHDAFKALLQDALAHNDQISNQTKELIKKMIS
ncbi:ParB/RepB/Spo0J family partition protein [Selenomonas sp.]|uniref:ParB/RepB/Spo0J family partition protein n=1 Tax=Selenomonas sp. TaxID=2053611 RepID=UPI002A751EE9|nr:ParB N-terminal domain-containing protein [Selenomonas sp.]MDY3297382.1 ParB N-terminal domain-containing protein [Selenomonas sp.]